MKEVSSHSYDGSIFQIDAFFYVRPFDRFIAYQPFGREYILDWGNNREELVKRCEDSLRDGGINFSILDRGEQELRVL